MIQLSAEQVANMLVNQGLREDLVTKTKEYIRSNKNIWFAYKKRALELATTTKSRIGSKKIFEDLRYDPELKSNTKFKCPNELTPYFAHFFVTIYPEHKSRFLFKCKKKTDQPAPGQQSLFN